MKGNNRSYLKRIIYEHKYKLIITYILFTLEMNGDLLKPLFVGKAVNDLMVGSYKSLFIFLGLHSLWVIVGVIRMRYDTRTYSKIYNAIMLKFLSEKTEQEDISKLSAHSTLTRELTDFLEYDLVYILEAVYNIFGSLVLLYFYDVKVVLLCVVTLIPISILSKYYGKKMSVLTHEKNNELENQVKTIATFDQTQIKQHYESLRKWQIKISDQQAYNFGIMEVVVAVLVGFALVISTQPTSEPLNQGELVGIYFYILKFNTGLDTIPYILEKYANLKDIIERITDFE
jgi:ABC-type multidrug transport system fused ATPase/permease subunit